MVQLKNLQRGDTLTEVMFATAVAALVIILGMTVMNRGFAQTQLTVENTFVRQSIDSEAELLRYSRDIYEETPSASTGGAKVWRDILNQQLKSNASAFGTCDTDSIPDSFFISSDDLDNITVNSATEPSETYAQIGKGVWIEAISPTFAPAQKIRYIDFHIRACWDPPFEGEKSTLGTIVRLYYEQK